jgi:hypothetical protein
MKSLKIVKHLHSINCYYGQHCPGTRFYFSDISVSNVALRLQNLKASKAAGVDNIPEKFLRRHHTTSLQR